MGVACLNFVKKIFTGDCKIAKFVKVFSLERFPLYGICVHAVCECVSILLWGMIVSSFSFPFFVVQRSDSSHNLEVSKQLTHYVVCVS